jgi:hypothetical protein
MIANMAETRLSPILLAALLLALGGQARADENTTHFVPTAPAETAPPPLSGITPVLEAGLIQLTRGFVFNQVYLNATEDCFAAASPPTLPRVGWCWSNTSASTAAPNFRRWDGSRWAAEAVLNVLNHGWGWPGSPPFPHVAPNPSLIASATATDSNDLWSKDFAGENGAPSVLHWPSLDSEAGACGNQVLASGDGCWRAAVALDRLEWGAKGDGTTEDTAAIRAAMADALANGRPGITLTPGIHKLSKTATGSDGSAVALLISGASNGFTLDCYGSTLSFNGSTPSNYAHVIRIENSSKVTLKNCEVDWSALPYTQATLSAINVGSADFQIDPVYPIAWTSVQQIEEFKPSTVGGIPAVWVKMVFDWTGGDRHVTNVGGGLYRVDFSADPAGLAKLATGHSYLLTSRFYGADGINAYNVDDLVLDNVRCDRREVHCDVGRHERHGKERLWAAAFTRFDALALGQC